MFTCVHTHTHTHTHTYTYKDNLRRADVLHEQLTPVEHLGTQILELKRSHPIKTLITRKQPSTLC